MGSQTNPAKIALKKKTKKNQTNEKTRVKESREFDEAEIQAGIKELHSLRNHPQNQKGFPSSA